MCRAEGSAAVCPRPFTRADAWMQPGGQRVQHAVAVPPAGRVCGDHSAVSSTCARQVQLQVPRWFVLPASTIERTGAVAVLPLAMAALRGALRPCALVALQVSSQGCALRLQCGSNWRLTRAHSTRPSGHLLPPAPPPIGPAGSAVMAKVLETAVPRFLQQLALDYAQWAAGDDTRQPVGSGSLSLVPEDGLEGLQGPTPEQEQGWD